MVSDTIFVALYYYYNKEEKNKEMKCFIPALALGMIAFAFMKYRDSTHEPVMNGNYFDT